MLEAMSRGTMRHSSVPLQRKLRCGKYCGMIVLDILVEQASSTMSESSLSLARMADQRSFPSRAGVTPTSWAFATGRADVLIWHSSPCMPRGLGVLLQVSIAATGDTSWRTAPYRGRRDQCNAVGVACTTPLADDGREEGSLEHPTVRYLRRSIIMLVNSRQ